MHAIAQRQAVGDWRDKCSRAGLTGTVRAHRGCLSWGGSTPAAGTVRDGKGGEAALIYY